MYSILHREARLNRTMLHPLIQDFMLYATVPVFTLFYWRGTWQLCAHYLYSHDEEKSAWCSLLVGYGGMSLFFAWQCLYQHTSLKQSFDIRSMFNEKGITPTLIFLLTRIESYLVGFFVVNAWRGLWLLQNLYLLTKSPLLSSWVSHIIGTVVLVLLLHLKSVYAPPVLFCRDDEYGITKLRALARILEKQEVDASAGADQASSGSDSDGNGDGASRSSNSLKITTESVTPV